MAGGSAVPLRFATWNMNIFTSGRTPEKLRLLEQHSVDVAALQEVKRSTAAAIRETFPGWTLIDAVDWSGWTSGHAHGAALLIRPGIEVLVAGGLTDDEWGAETWPEGLGPSLGCVARAQILVDDVTVEVMSAHPPNAAAPDPAAHLRRALAKVATYGAMTRHIGSSDPVILGLDSNMWVDTAVSPFGPPKYPENDPQRPIMEFLIERAEPHGLRDLFRDYLQGRPIELEEIRRRRPRGPLATTYVRGSNRPVPDRFDLILGSRSVSATSFAHHYEDALAVGSDHALVVADLEITP